MEFVVLFIIWLVLGASTAYLANQKGRDPLLWSMGILTLSLLGPLVALVGIAFLYFLPAVDDTDESIPERHEFEELLPIPPEEKFAQELSRLEWFYYDSQRERHGPLSFLQLQDAWANTFLSDDTYVWNENMDTWKKASDVPGLIDALKRSLQKTPDDEELPF